MVTIDLAKRAIPNLEKSYKDLLKNNIYQDSKMVKELFADSKTKSSFNELIETYFEQLIKFYFQKPNGTYLEELEFVLSNTPIKNCLSSYYSATNDATIFKFLLVYSYCMQEYCKDDNIFDENNFLISKKMKKYFEITNTNSINMYEKLKKDIDAKNYWWLKDNATTLRRQLCENLVILSRSRCQALCDKFFIDKVDIVSQFYLVKNGGDTLLPKLDDAMYETYNALPFFCWWETDANGNRMLIKSENPPKDGRYFFNAYQQDYHNERVDNQK